MEDDQYFIEFYTELQDIVNSMRRLREEVSNSKVVRKILRSLPNRFYHKVTAVEESKDLDKIKVEKLLGSLETFELKLKLDK